MLGVSSLRELWELWESSGRGVGAPGAGLVAPSEVWGALGVGFVALGEIMGALGQDSLLWARFWSPGSWFHICGKSIGVGARHARSNTLDQRWVGGLYHYYDPPTKQ